MTAPLEGVRALDLTRMLPGNYCTWLLSTLGAEVVKVEDPGAGDYMRSFGAQVDGQGATHHLVNRGKRSIVVDLKHPDGVALLQRMAGRADVLVESFRPGVLARLGLGVDELRAANPAIVVVSISGYGATGPLVREPGHDLNYLATAGLLDRLAPAGGRPVVPHVPFADLIGGGLVPAIAAVALVHRARTTGEGGHVDASLTDAIALLPNLVVADVLAGAKVPGPGATDFGGGLACYRVYELEDGFVTVGAVEERFWAALCETLGEPDLVAVQYDRAHQDEIAARLGRRFLAMDRAEVERTFAGVDACVAVVRSAEEVVRSGYAEARGLVREGDGIPMPVLAPPFLVDGERPPERGRAPHQGEHTREVLEDWGVGAADVDRLLADGAVRQRDG